MNKIQTGQALPFTGAFMKFGNNTPLGVMV